MRLAPDLQQLLLELATAQRSHATGVQPQRSQEYQDLLAAQQEQQRAYNAASAAQLAVDDMELEILRIQEDERKLRRRVADDKRQLGAATDPEMRKDLEKDLYSAKSRIADLMSELAEAHNEIHALRNNVDKHQQHVADAEAAVVRAQETYDNQPSETTEQQRQERIAYLRDVLPAEIIAEYDAQRFDNAVGVARFNGRSCGGCFIMLPAVEIAQIRGAASDEVPQCPDCGSYLVRDV